MRQCPHCGGQLIASPISKEPFWLGEGNDRKFNWIAFKKKNIIWKNLFMPSWSLFWIALILYLVWAYNADIANCEQTLEPIKKDVCGFCFKFKQPCEKRVIEPDYVVDINLT